MTPVVSAVRITCVDLAKLPSVLGANQKYIVAYSQETKEEVDAHSPIQERDAGRGGSKSGY
jgi:hypothetical protein